MCYHKSIPNHRCDFCQIQHGQPYRLRKVKYLPTGKFTTFWVDEWGYVRCPHTGKKIDNWHIQSEPVSSMRFYQTHKAVVKPALFKDGKKNVCKRCYKREHAAGNCKPNTRPKTSTKSNQTGTENEPQPQLFT
jgi:hypothetical protein